MKKRGLSDVVTVLIIVLISLVAIAILWFTVSKLVGDTSEKITFSPYSNEIKLTQVERGLSAAIITLSRTSGKDNLTKLKFVSYTETSSNTFEIENPGLEILETKTFFVPLDEIGLSNRITVYPIFGENVGLPVETNLNGVAVNLKKDSDLLSYYQFDGNTQDSSNKGNDVTQTIDPSLFVSGIKGNALNFSENGLRFITIPNEGIFDADNNELTLSLWVKEEKHEGYSKLLIKPHINSGNPWELFAIDINTTSSARFIISDGIQNSANLKLGYNNPNDGWESVDSNISIELNKWYHIAGTYNGSVMKIFINGEKSSQENSGIIIGSNNKAVTVGNSDVVAQSLGLDGLLDEVMIYNRSLSDEEIKIIYDLQK